MASSPRTPRLIIHGGAGRAIRDRSRAQAVGEALGRIRDAVYERLADGCTAREAVVLGCRMLEDDPLFNAGTGSVMQSDGQIRMSASLMDGGRHAFSGVINASRLKNPIELAAFLQTEKDRVLSDLGALELMREIGVKPYDPLVERRLTEWIAQRCDAFDAEAADVVSEGAADADDDRRKGTIGVVALDQDGQLCAGTSTGGRGFERIGRVSDTAMPAGNYADARSAVSCTGIGEDIVDECLAARIVVRVADGMSLVEAIARSMDEGERRERVFGVIGIDADGHIGWGKTSEILLAAWRDGDDAGDTLDLTTEPVTGCAGE